MRRKAAGGEPRSIAPDPVRIDKWLWAARFFKSRALAAEAITSGKVEVNGDRVKPARELKPGDRVRLRLGPYEQLLTVTALSERRGPAAQAALLYEETAESRLAREKLRWQLRYAAPIVEMGEGRPTKKDRRALRRLKEP
jgi:ribosome-associated heat shock protein Hsp15